MEVIRHRAGFGFSQVSQRYVDGSKLRFVERPEFQQNEELHNDFINRIDRTAADYERLAQELLKLQKDGKSELSAEHKTDLRKKINQTARCLLTNETEAPIVVTSNCRSWRHFIEMRASEHAETEICNLAIRVYKCLKEVAPIIFDDYTVTKHANGMETVDTKYRKV